MKHLILTFALLLLAPHAARAQPVKGKPLADTFNELLPKLEKDNGAQQQWQDLCFKLGTPGKESDRTEACKLMCAKLDAKTPAATRLWLLTQLERIGGEESVGALAALIDDKDDVVREAAVRALANNPGKSATGKLTGALGGAKGSAKVGLLNALAHRADPAAEGAAYQALRSDDEAAAVAAARVLARIPGGTAHKLLAAERGQAKGAARAAIDNALLVHADRMVKDKDIGNAAAIYQLLNTKEEPRAVRLAALRGVIQTAGDKAGDLVLETLAGDDTAAQAVAVGQIEYLSVGALKTLAANLDKLPVPSRVSVITAIAARGDRTQVAVALAAAKSTEADVKRAGLLALGRLGDASAVELLLDVMSGKDANAGLAAESLAALTAEGVDAKLIAELAKEKTSTRAVVLIGVLARRKATTAVPELVKSANAPVATVRTAAFAALKVLASPADVPGMIPGLLRTEKGAEREAAEVAIATVSAQAAKPEDRAVPVLAALKSDKEHAADLLPLLGRIGGPDALRVIREHIAGSDSAIRRAAFTGLCNWPDSSANADLLALAEGDKEAANRLAALQALIRVNCVLVDRTPEERLAVLTVMKKAMPVATRDDERRALLGGIGFVRHIETLRFVAPYLDEPALAQAACKGVVELAHSKMLREPNREEFAKALDRVIGLCKDKALVDRAKQYKDGR